MAYKQQIITFITYEEYISLQEIVGDCEIAQFELADSIITIFETIQFEQSKIKLDPLLIDVQK